MLTLAERAYPDLQAEAQEQLALNRFLALLDNPQVAFSVRQKAPKTIEDAVTATLEMESYLPRGHGKIANVGAEMCREEVELNEDETVGAAGYQAGVMERLV